MHHPSLNSQAGWCSAGHSSSSTTEQIPVEASIQAQADGALAGHVRRRLAVGSRLVGLLEICLVGPDVDELVAVEAPDEQQRPQDEAAPGHPFGFTLITGPYFVAALSSAWPSMIAIGWSAFSVETTFAPPPSLATATRSASTALVAKTTATSSPFAAKYPM